jgi:hypothetical protein
VQVVLILEEQQKKSRIKILGQLVVSNFHRVTESFRVLEEIAKLVNTKKISEVKKVKI